MKITHLHIDGEPVRRFWLVAEVTFRDRFDSENDDLNYYGNSELRERIENWVARGLDDRDDGPSITFHPSDHRIPEFEREDRS